MPSFAFLGFKVAMPCTVPNGHERARAPHTHSVKHGGLTHSVKQNQVYPLV